tara:strand:- start:456 stop:1313 length:858 start_codon:yes stop_codon:yes gene_type:complete
MSKIYDCFNFFNELDILELRLNTLYDHVDFFVIVESDVTHSGEPKKFFYEEHRERFSKFADKILNYKILNTPSDFINLPETDEEELKKVYTYIETQSNRFNRATQLDYGRDFFQKESVRRALAYCKDDDIIMFSDADEIPNPEFLKTIKNLSLDDTLYSLNQPMYCYFLNMLKQSDWYGTKVGLYKNIKDLSLNELRGDESLTVKLPDGGWHFSFIGDAEMVRKKITSYSARDLVNQHVYDSVEDNIKNGIDVFFRGKLTQVPIDSSYPTHILNNLDKYKHMIKP